MAQTKRQIESALADVNSRPRHRFGQNFMIDSNLVRLIADSGNIQPGDLVIEVGPGTGTLTEELLERVDEAGRVVAVEIDRDLARTLRERFIEEPRFHLIEGDALSGKHGLNQELVGLIHSGRDRRIRLVANLPYNIASPLVVELLLAGVSMLAFTVQKEVALRLRAGPEDGKAYGPLSVIVQHLAEVEVLRTIPPTAFWPAPKIDSALVRLTKRFADDSRARELATFVTALFSQRRKTLRRALAPLVDDADAVLATLGLDPTLRPDRLDAQTLQLLFKAVGGA